MTHARQTEGAGQGARNSISGLGLSQGKITGHPYPQPVGDHQDKIGLPGPYRQ